MSWELRNGYVYINANVKTISFSKMQLCNSGSISNCELFLSIPEVYVTNWRHKNKSYETILGDELLQIEHDYEYYRLQDFLKTQNNWNALVISLKTIVFSQSYFSFVPLVPHSIRLTSIDLTQMSETDLFQFIRLISMTT